MKILIRSLARKALDHFGYEVSRKGAARNADRSSEVCAQCNLETLAPVSLDDYRRECQPLFEKPAEVPGLFSLRHYQSIAAAVKNISMGNYFETKEDAGRFFITDVYSGSHYYSRQRMLYAAYRQRWGASLRNLSVLDIGCSSGYYSFFCSRLGANEVLGVDARPEHEDQFRLLHQMLEMPDSCRYRHLDMECELENLEGSFDLVLAQGIMYHVYDHPRFIRNLFRMTRSMLVLEGACSGRADLLCKAEMEQTENLRASIHGPVLYPSLPWMVTLLRWVGFKQVTYVMYPSDVPDTNGYAGLWRAMLVAEK